MIDPLTEVVTLLHPLPLFSKVVSGSGSWRVRRAEEGRPFYCVVIEGSCCLAASGQAPITLEAGDFVLIPSAYDFTMSSPGALESEEFETIPERLPSGEFRLGIQEGPADVQNLVGYCTFDSPDAALLVSLLPQIIHVRGEKRLSMLVQLVVDESRAQRPAREVILPRLLEVLLIEALRSASSQPKSPGLLSGLADERLAAALRRIHQTPAHGWTVEQLAKEASLSRSAFYDRFRRALGIAPMEYLFVLRMALAKRLLQSDDEGNVATVAERVGYGSASAFSVAFTRHVGVPPARYARQRAET
jgi:AraC-like DNA-binding protein